MSARVCLLFSAKQRFQLELRWTAFAGVSQAWKAGRSTSEAFTIAEVDTNLEKIIFQNILTGQRAGKPGKFDG